MPVYVYRCVEGHKTEQVRPIGERDEPRPCPDCGELQSERVPAFTTNDIIFLGTGWAKKDRDWSNA